MALAAGDVEGGKGAATGGLGTAVVTGLRLMLLLGAVAVPLMVRHSTLPRHPPSPHSPPALATSSTT